MTHLSYASVIYILSYNVRVVVCVDLCQELEHGVIQCSAIARSSHVRKRLWSIPRKTGNLEDKFHCDCFYKLIHSAAHLCPTVDVGGENEDIVPEPLHDGPGLRCPVLPEPFLHLIHL